MIKPKHILYPLIGFPLFVLLFWFISIPTELIQEKFEEAISQTGNSDIEVSIKGLSKGILLSLHLSEIELKVQGAQAISINDLSARFSPKHVMNGEIALQIDGRVADGTISGLLKLPVWGNIRITDSKLSSVAYLTKFGIAIEGTVQADLEIVENRLDVKFDVPDLAVGDTTTIIPLINTFRKLQGALSVEGNTVTVHSVSLEGDKGYARLKGKIRNGRSDLSLELMPENDKLTAMESMIIGKYIVSPGYYVVPVKGFLP